MIRTPQYKMPAFLQGDFLYAPDDQQRVTITDIQLEEISSIIGDGVLNGWQTTAVKIPPSAPSPNAVAVSPGQGFIGEVLHKTLSRKYLLVPASPYAYLYMQSTMLGGSTGFGLETESPASNLAWDTFHDSTPPAVPAGFAATPDATSFDTINLTWLANSEPDFSHYEIGRGSTHQLAYALTNGTFVVGETFTATGGKKGFVTAVLTGPDRLQYALLGTQFAAADAIVGLTSGAIGTVSGAPIVAAAASYAIIGTRKQNETSFSDSGLAASTIYYYRIRALDISSNASGYVSANATTIADTRQPTEASGLSLRPGNGTASIYWNQSPENDITYRLTVEPLNPDGSIASTTVYNTPYLFYQLSGLSNAVTYRMTLQTKAATGVLSNGVVAEMTPSSSSAPLDVIVYPATSVTAQPHAVQLAWTANPLVLSGNGVGQKSEYRIRVIDKGIESAPIRGIGLATTKTVTSYNETAVVGEGQTVMLADDVVYVFRITTLDVFGNESSGAYVKGATQDTTPPKDPRSLTLDPGNETIQVTWKHSSSSDVVGYILNIDAGAGFGPDINIPYLETYLLSGLVNGVQTRIKVRAKDDAGNISSPGIFGTTVPFADTTAPSVPTNLVVNPGDEQATASWTASPEPDVAKYIVKRMAITQTLSVQRGVPLTEATELAPVFDAGRVTSVSSGAIFRSADMIGKNYVGYVLVMANGLANGLKSAIVSMNPANGEMVLATALAIIPSANDRFSIKQTHPSLGTVVRDVGLATEVFDPGLAEGQVYAYYVKAIDSSGNESAYSPYTLVSPRQGANDIAAATGLTAVFSGSAIVLNWLQVVPTPSHPATNHTGFNVYRSLNQYYGFELIDSTPATVLTYSDTLLVNNTLYYYYVTAVRDNADLYIDPSDIQPANSILLATLEINPVGPSIISYANVPRLAAQIESTVEEEVSRRLLSHRHSVKPTNSSTVTAVPFVAALDASSLTEDMLASLPLSPDTLAYYESLLKDENLQPIVYVPQTTYVFHPATVVWNAPFVGDFQIFVNGVAPTVDFAMDTSRNAIIFTSPLPDNSIVSFDGGNGSYYVPSKLSLDFRGFDVLVDGNPAEPSVDDVRQTLRFATRLTAEQVVTVVVEPTTPSFGTQDGARQVSLSPNIVLSDFTTQNNTLYQSEAGTFGSTDTFFVLVNDARTSLGHSVDTSAKTVTFDAPLPEGSVVSLEILNKLEVDGLLPASRIGGVDGSQFTTGQFALAQLPSISHAGRIKERAFPLFQSLATTDKYVYETTEGVLGAGTTPYSVFQLADGSLLLGSSTGLLKTTGFAAFNAEGGSTNVVIDYSQKPPPGLTFQKAGPDDMVTKTRAAAKYSGRFNGNVTITTLVGGLPTPLKQIYGPNLMELEDGTILISGGANFNANLAAYFETTETYVYDPATKVCEKEGDLGQKRSGHSGVRLPNGNVLVCGGSYDSIIHFEQTTFTPDWIDTIRLDSAEIYDWIAKTWQPVAARMGARRDYHVVLLLNNDEVLVAGGNTGISSFNGIYKPPRVIHPTPVDSAEIYNITLGTWAPAVSMNRKRVGAEGKVDKGTAIVTGGGQEGRELFARTPSDHWILELGMTQTEQNSFLDEFGRNSIDYPVKQFFQDSTGLLLVVSQKNVYASGDQGETFVRMKGLEAVGVVHAVSESSNGTLFAATDLGVYEITAVIHDALTWFQGGLIGVGTTETFDLQPVGAAMLAATEIGIFSSVDDGDTWTEAVALENVYNIEIVGSYLFANAGQVLYRSNDLGTTWNRVATLSFIDADTKMIGRTPLDLFFATAAGLYASRDGVSFFRVDFDRNRNPESNNVHMATLLSTDMIVGYDNEMYSVGPDMEVILLAEFVGAVPTVNVNGEEARTGFRYDINKFVVVFERKRFAKDVVTATSNYALYQMENGEWYSQNPNGAVSVFVNGKLQDSTSVASNAMLGQASFSAALSKPDVVTASLVGTSLEDAGEYFHDELEDKIEREKGLPLSLGRDHSGDILQMGISVEHNFLERGLERNQYYCSTGIEVDRSFNSFLSNAEFYIMGRREFDRFNSTIDYSIESEQKSIGKSALVPLSTLEVPANLWVGTESGVFILNPFAPIPFSVSSTKQIGEDGNEIRDLKYFQGNIYAVTRTGLFFSENAGVDFEKNAGNGLPTKLFTLASMGNTMFLGTENGVYYSDGSPQNPDYDLWFRVAFTEKGGTQEVAVTESCVAMTVSDGVAYAGLGGRIFFSFDGKTWQFGYAFADDTVRITSLAVFAKRLFVGTNKGLYSDDGTVKSDSPALRLENVGTVPAEFYVNDLGVYSDGTATYLYAVGDESYVYRMSGMAPPSVQSETWSGQAIPEAKAIHKFIMVGGYLQVALANDTVFVQ